MAVEGYVAVLGELVNVVTLVAVVGLLGTVVNIAVVTIAMVTIALVTSAMVAVEMVTVALAPIAMITIAMITIAMVTIAMVTVAMVTVALATSAMVGSEQVVPEFASMVATAGAVLAAGIPLVMLAPPARVEGRVAVEDCSEKRVGGSCPTQPGESILGQCQLVPQLHRVLQEGVVLVDHLPTVLVRDRDCLVLAGGLGGCGGGGGRGGEVSLLGREIL